MVIVTPDMIGSLEFISVMAQRREALAGGLRDRAPRGLSVDLLAVGDDEYACSSGASTSRHSA